MSWRALWGCGLLVLAFAGCDRATVIVEQPESPTPPSTPATAELERAREAVREAVRRYTGALEAHDAAAATATVMRETFQLYEELRVLALHGTRVQLEQLDLMTVMMVLQIRAHIVRSELESIDGRTLFERAVAAGILGGEFDDVSLDEVWIDEAGAHAEIRLDGQPIVWLQEQDEQWRVDLITMIRMLGPTIESMAGDRILTDGRLRTALALIELGTDDFVNMDVLDGPL